MDPGAPSMNSLMESVVKVTDMAPRMLEKRALLPASTRAWRDSARLRSLELAADRSSSAALIAF